jgi:predicted DNA-binding transcriptional regulator AlpA
MSSKLRAELFQSVGDLDALMDGRQVCQFFGNISKMTIYRWVQNPASGFPPPFKIGQKNFWVRRDIIAFRDMRRARAQAGRTHNPPRGLDEAAARQDESAPRAQAARRRCDALMGSAAVQPAGTSRLLGSEE